MPDRPSTYRDRIRRMRHALEVGIASMHDCSAHDLHHTAKRTMINTLRFDKKISLNHKKEQKS